MLQIQAHPDRVEVNGTTIETLPPCVTRYRGDAWDKIASDILCGTADVNQDVCIAVTAEPYMTTDEEVGGCDPDEWARWPADDPHASYWHRFDDGSWLFVPKSRDAVEAVMAWTMPYLNEGTGIVAADSRSYAFGAGDAGEGDLITALLTAARGRGAVIESLKTAAFFEFTWTYSLWKLFPGRHSVDHLIRLVEPVVSRINATLL